MRGRIHLLTSTPKKGTINTPSSKQGRNQNVYTRRRRNRKKKEEKGTEKGPLDFDVHRAFFPSPDRRRSPAPWFACIQIVRKGLISSWFGLGFWNSERDGTRERDQRRGIYKWGWHSLLESDSDRFQSWGGGETNGYLISYFGVLAQRPLCYEKNYIFLYIVLCFWIVLQIYSFVNRYLMEKWIYAEF